MLEEIERGIVLLRNSHNLIAEVCQRLAERLVQWTLAVKSDGESFFQAILSIREAVNAEIEENTQRTRGRPFILIFENQLLFLLEHGRRYFVCSYSKIYAGSS